MDGGGAIPWGMVKDDDMAMILAGNESAIAKIEHPPATPKQREKAIADLNRKFSLKKFPPPKPSIQELEAMPGQPEPPASHTDEEVPF